MALPTKSLKVPQGHVQNRDLAPSPFRKTAPGTRNGSSIPIAPAAAAQFPTTGGSTGSVADVVSAPIVVRNPTIAVKFPPPLEGSATTELPGTATKKVGPLPPIDPTISLLDC